MITSPKLCSARKRHRISRFFLFWLGERAELLGSYVLARCFYTDAAGQHGLAFIACQFALPMCNGAGHQNVSSKMLRSAAGLSRPLGAERC